MFRVFSEFKMMLNTHQVSIAIQQYMWDRFTKESEQLGFSKDDVFWMEKTVCDFESGLPPEVMEKKWQKCHPDLGRYTAKFKTSILTRRHEIQWEYTLKDLERACQLYLLAPEDSILTIRTEPTWPDHLLFVKRVYTLSKERVLLNQSKGA